MSLIQLLHAHFDSWLTSRDPDTRRFATILLSQADAWQADGRIVEYVERLTATFPAESEAAR
jgi:hypothetical protein